MRSTKKPISKKRQVKNTLKEVKMNRRKKTKIRHNNIIFGMAVSFMASINAHSIRSCNGGRGWNKNMIEKTKHLFMISKKKELVFVQILGLQTITGCFLISNNHLW